MEKYFLIFLIVLCGCSSSQKATEYTERYIQQAYTLPDDVNVWGWVGTAYVEREDGRTYSWAAPIPIPLYWEYSINDNLTLEIPILPLGLRWRISSSDVTETGLRFFNGIGYSSYAGPMWTPELEFSYKRFVNKNQALFVEPAVSYKYYGKSRNEDESYASGRIGFAYLFQLNDRNAIAPKVILRYSEKTEKLGVPVELFYTYRVSKTWQFESTYRYSETPATYIADDYIGHFFNFIVKKFF